MKLEGKKVLVTGAGGFIGSHLVEHLLSRNCSVRALVHYDTRPGYGGLDCLSRQDREGVEIVAGDVCDAGFLRRVMDGCDVVFHLAALIGVPYSYAAPASYVATNVGGTLNLLEAARACETPRVVHTSTSECYGSAITTPMREDHPLQAQSPYAASKIGADQLVESYHRSFGLPVSILRPFNNYGPRQTTRAVVPSIVSQLLWGGESLRLGALDPVRDFLFVEDTCAAFTRIAEVDAAVGETIHVGTGKSISIGDLARLLMQLMGVEKPIEQDAVRFRPEASEVRELVCDASKAVSTLAWTPSVDLGRGLRHVVDFISDHADEYRGANYAV
jgi:NAD dependent epimerase/dehydratase